VEVIAGNKLQMFIDRCLQRIMGIRGHNIISNAKPWEASQ
jgi:hypothetical protein